MQRLSLLSVAILVLALPGVLYLSQQTQIFKPKAQNVELAQTIERLNNDLFAAQKDYQRPGIADTEKEKKITTMVSLASQRKEALVKEAKLDPKAFLKHVLSPETRETFPSQVQALFEQDVQLQGRVVVRHSDNFDQNTSQTDYFLDTDTSGSQQARIPQWTHNLYFATNPPNFLTGTTVAIQGVAIDNTVVVPAGQQPFLQVISAAQPSVLQDVKAAVILMNFQYQVATPTPSPRPSPPISAPLQSGIASYLPVTKEQIIRTLFTAQDSVKNYYTENSFGNINVLYNPGGSSSSEVMGPFTIPYSPDSCWNDYGWIGSAAQEAQDNGIDLDSFSHLMFVFPYYISDCGYGGWAYIGGTVSVMNQPTLGVFAHELGHNLGVHHASTLYCGSKAIDDYTNCQGWEYGDPADVMGASSQAHFNAPHKVEVGWISGSGIREVTQNGTYTATAIEATSSATQVLKIPKSDTNEYYWLEYRQPTGFDSIPTLPAAFTSGVGIRIWKENRYYSNQTKLIDTTPKSNTWDVVDAPLSDGTSFVDPANGITIKQTGHTATTATVEVTFTPPPTSLFIKYWRILRPLPERVRDHSLETVNGFLLNIGGWRDTQEGSQESADVNLAKINSDGTIGSWSAATPLPVGLAGPATTTYDNYVFVTGGLRRPTSHGVGGGPSSNVYYTKVNSDGTLNSWARTRLPESMTNHAAVAYRDRLFVIGGTQSYLSDAEVYSAVIKPDGSLGEWAKTVPLPIVLYGHAAVAYSDYIYVLGGAMPNGSLSKKVFFAKVNPDGTLGMWSETTSLPKGISEQSAVSYGGYILLSGGRNRDWQTQAGAYVAKVNSDGTLGAWSQDTPLPRSLTTHSSAAHEGYLFVTGGRDENWSSQSSVYSAPLDIPATSQHLVIAQGWSLVGLTAEKGSNYKAEDFLSDMNASFVPASVPNRQAPSGDKVLYIYKFDSSRGRFKLYIPGRTDTENFSIQAGEGYFIRANWPGTATVSGLTPTLSSITVPRGFSMISFPRALTGITNAAELLQAIQAQGIDVRLIVRWFGGRYIVYDVGSSANNFSITPGEGYFIRNFGSTGTFTLP